MSSSVFKNFCSLSSKWGFKVSIVPTLYMYLIVKINIIADSTNAYIKTVRETFSRARDANTTTEIKALIGLLYLADVYTANLLNVEDLRQTNGSEWKYSC